MSMFTHHLLFDHFQFALIHRPNIPGSYVILFFTALDFTFTTRHIHNSLVCALTSVLLLGRLLFYSQRRHSGLSHKCPCPEEVDMHGPGPVPGDVPVQTEDGTWPLWHLYKEVCLVEEADSAFSCPLLCSTGTIFTSCLTSTASLDFHYYTCPSRQQLWPGLQPWTPNPSHCFKSIHHRVIRVVF